MYVYINKNQKIDFCVSIDGAIWNHSNCAPNPPPSLLLYPSPSPDFALIYLSFLESARAKRDTHSKAHRQELTPPIWRAVAPPWNLPPAK